MISCPDTTIVATYKFAYTPTFAGCLEDSMRRNRSGFHSWASSPQTSVRLWRATLGPSDSKEQRAIPLVSDKRSGEDLSSLDRYLPDRFARGRDDRVGERNDVVLESDARKAESNRVEAERFLQVAYELPCLLCSRQVLTLIALLVRGNESKSSAPSSPAPRWTAFARTSLISRRMRSWYSGCLASSYNKNVRVDEVVSWPARVSVNISAASSSSSKRVLASAEWLALTARLLSA